MTPEQFRARLIDLDREWGRVNTLTDIAETKAAAMHGVKAWEPETELEFIAATLEFRP